MPARPSADGDEAGLGCGAAGLLSGFRGRLAESLSCGRRGAAYAAVWAPLAQAPPSPRSRTLEASPALWPAGGCAERHPWGGGPVPRVGVAAVSLALLGAVAVAGLRGTGHPRDTRPLRARPEANAGLQEQSVTVASQFQTPGTSPLPPFEGKCQLVEKDVDYLAGGPGPGDFPLDHIPDPGMCCAMCHGIPECVSWVWKNGHLKDCPYQCWILVSERKARAPAQGAVSGVPPLRPQLRLPAPTFVQQPATAGTAGAGFAGDLSVSSSSALALRQDSGAPHTAAEDDERKDCAAHGENCWEHRCCKDATMRCFMKNPQWAGCKKSCQPGVDPSDPPEARTAWTCKDVNKEPGLPGLPPLPDEKLTPPPPPPPYQPLPPLAEEATAPGVGQGPGLSGLTCFCFSLVQPEGYEPKLLRAQHALGTSIFACEAYAVYSNRAFEIAPGVTTSVVKNSLKCEFHEIAWNTGIFIAVWHKVCAQAWYRSYDWCIKVDPDATFFPHRLVALLPEHAGAGYLGNCKYGLHGPIEVLSRGAVDMLAQDYASSPDGTRPQRCIETFPQAITGKAQWGEDMFLDWCLHKVLGVRRQTEDRLMCEAHCDCPNWYWCHNDTSRVTYHPFKREDMYRQCIANAMYGAPES